MSSKQYSSSSTQAVVANESVFFSEIHSNKAFQIFQEMRAKEELCDVYVCCAGRRFPAHRVVLAGTCPLFREKLAAAHDESTSIKQPYEELEIPEHFDKLLMLQVLEFLYEGKLVLNVNHVKELLQLLCYLKVKCALIIYVCNQHAKFNFSVHIRSRNRSRLVYATSKL